MLRILYTTERGEPLPLFLRASDILFTKGVTLKRATIIKMIFPTRSVFVSKSYKMFEFSPKSSFITMGMNLKSDKRKRI